MNRTGQTITIIRPATSANGRLHGGTGEIIEIELEPDPSTGTSQWFHFGIEAPPGKRIRIVNAGASTYPRGWSDNVIWTRSHRGQWHQLSSQWDNVSVEFTHNTRGAHAFFALFPPFPPERMEPLLCRVRAHPDADVVEANETSGAALRISLGDRDPMARQIWIVAAQHGGEHPTIWFAEGLVDTLLKSRRPRRGIRFHIVPVANRGGMMAGHLRTNTAGKDPNRHWGSPSACLEVDTLLAAMASTGVDFLLDVHTDFESRCVYLDVLDEYLNTAPNLIAIRRRFEQQLAGQSRDVALGTRYPWQAPPHDELLAGMCAPVIERRFGAAAVTLEMPIARYRNAAGREDVWTPKHAFTLGCNVAKILLKDIWGGRTE